MLLRSSSTPVLNSWIIPSNYTNSNSNSSPNHLSEHKPSLTRTNSLSTRATSSSSSSPRPSPTTDHTKPSVSTRFDDSDLQDPPWPITTRLFWSSGLDEVLVPSVAEDGGCNGGDRGVIDGGGGGGGDGDGGGYGFCDYNSNNNNSIDKYYQRMIKANPGDPLLLGNYARFLKEVRGDLGKAEECCGRAILINPSDANLLNLYAEIIWQHRKDAQRAETYFQQAIQAASQDCYVHASYAKFLWDVEEEETEVTNDDLGNTSPSPPHYIEETFRCSPLPTR